MLRDTREQLDTLRAEIGLAKTPPGRPPGATYAKRSGKARVSKSDDAKKYSLRAGDQLRRVREDAGVTQAELAAACAVAFTTVSHWERRGCLTVWRLWQIAGALGVPVSHLVPE